MKTKITGYDRESLKDFKINLRETQKDVDEVLDAANLQRKERQPIFSSRQLMALFSMLMICILGVAGSVCVTLAGMTGAVIPIIFVTMIFMMFTGIILLTE